VIAIILIAGGDDDKSTTVTQPGTTTTLTTTTTDTTTTQEQPPGISQQDAQTAAQNEASNTAESSGISLAPDDFEARCTAEGGTETSDVWNCQVTSTNGQCSGTITVVQQQGISTRDNEISCGE
jgi:hypothetical protein